VRGLAVIVACFGVPWLASTNTASAQTSAGKPDITAQKQERRARAGNLVGHGGPVKVIRVDPISGHVLTGAFDYAAMLWDVSGDTPKQLRRLDDHTGAVNAVAFSGDGTKVLTAGDDFAVSLWDAATGALIHRFKGHTGKIVGLSVSADGRTAVSASWDRTARLWDLGTGQPAGVLDGHAGPVNAAVFSADSTHIFTASADGTIGRFERASGKLDRAIYKHGWGLNVLERLPGTDHVVFGALNGAVGVINGTTGAVIRELPSHDRPVLALAVLDKPGLIATGSGDGSIRVLRAADGSVIETYKTPYGPIWSLAFLAGGDKLYYAGLDDFATLWRITPRDAFEAIDSTFPRRFQKTGAADDAVARGELQFARKCSICHTLTPDTANRAGPSLFGVFGRRIATLPGYPFTPALKTLDIVWTGETISKLFELGPEDFTPGSKMPLQKMTRAGDRDDLIAYLRIATVDAPDATGQDRPNAPEPGRKGDTP
jgi:cytochrome c